MSLTLILFILSGISSLILWWTLKDRKKWKEKAQDLESDLDQLKNNIKRYENFYGKISQIHKECQEDDNKSVHDLTSDINSALSMQ